VHNGFNAFILRTGGKRKKTQTTNMDRTANKFHNVKTETLLHTEKRFKILIKCLMMGRFATTLQHVRKEWPDSCNRLNHL